MYTLKKMFFYRDKLRGKIIAISTVVVITSVLFISTLINYSVEHLIVKETEEELKKELTIFEEVLTDENVDLDRELDEMGRLFSVIIYEYPKGITYITSPKFLEIKRVLKSYLVKIIGGPNLERLGSIGFDKSINKSNKYIFDNNYLIVKKLPKNDFFKDETYIFLIKDMSYLADVKFATNIILGIILVGLIILQLLLINYAMERIFGALRELNDFTGSIYSESEEQNLSVRFEKRYGNEEVDKLIDTLNALIDDVEGNIKSIEEFSSNVSHELKTPMASIKSMIEIDLVQEREAKDYEETLLKILEEINWMNGMIKELLNLTRNPEILKQSFKEVNLYSLGNEICDIMEILALESEIDLSWDFSLIKEAKVHGDGGSIKQVIMNLVNNSIKYNKENGWIRVWGEDHRDTIKIVVEDCGVGIKKENIEKITKRFFREDNVRTHKKSGVGLGLSIVKHILEVHKGYLEIYSEEGRGSIFKVCLPKKK